MILRKIDVRKNDLSSYLATRSTQFQWYLTEVKEATERSQLTRESHLLGNGIFFFYSGPPLFTNFSAYFREVTWASTCF